MLETILEILKYLGITSFVGLASLYIAWISFPPDLIIDAVVDKSKKFNSESKIRIKNIGKLPALSIVAEVDNLTGVFGGNRMINCTIANAINKIGRLAHSETSEISVRPGIYFKKAVNISEFSYVLVLKYHAKVLFLKKEFSKTWGVSLRNYEDGFSWDIVIE